MLNLGEYWIIEFLLLMDYFCLVILLRDERFSCIFNSVNISCTYCEPGIVWVLRIILVTLIVEIIISLTFIKCLLYMVVVLVVDYWWCVLSAYCIPGSPHRAILLLTSFNSHKRLWSQVLLLSAFFQLRRLMHKI